MAAETPLLHRSSKQLLLHKISSMRELRKYSSQKEDKTHPAWNEKGLKMLLDDSKSKLDMDFAPAQQVRLLNCFYSMRLRDENLLE